MYTDEDKGRILADPFENGVKLSTFCRTRPGVPSDPQSGGWLREAEEGSLEIPERFVRGRVGDRPKHSRYPEETARVNLPRSRLHLYAAFSSAASFRFLASNSSGLRFPSAECMRTLL